MALCNFISSIIDSQIFHLKVALLVVLAQAGSFVPADFMALCPFSSLFTRMGTGDSIETNSSSFMLEMQVCVCVCVCGWVGV